MTQHLEAIFDNGVFRPIVPVSLPDQTRVDIIVTPAGGQASAEMPDKGNDKEESEDEVAARQWQSARELDELMAQLPNNSPDDGFSGADHDRILYGGPT